MFNSRYSVLIFHCVICLIELIECRHNVSRGESNTIEHDLINSMGRLPKFLTFHTLQDDVRIDLEFSVPFLKIPVKSTSDTASLLSRNLGNINVTALVLTGIIILAGFSASALFSSLGRATLDHFKTINKRAFDDILAFGYTKADGSKTESTIWEIFEQMENKLGKFDVDLTSCVQMTTCAIIAKSYGNVISGNSTPMDKVIDGITSFEWLMNWIEGTAIRDSIKLGKNDANCTEKYRSCKLTEKQIMNFLKSI